MDTYYISYFTSSVWDEAKYTTTNAEASSDDEITLSEEDDRLVDYSISTILNPGKEKNAVLLNCSYNLILCSIFVNWVACGDWS